MLYIDLLKGRIGGVATAGDIKRLGLIQASLKEGEEVRCG